MSSQNVDQDSMNTSVAQLAAVAQKDEEKRRGVHIPIARLGTIIAINSNDSTQDLSNIITNQAVDGIYNKCKTS
ncbi:hypothetical protein HDU76_000928 [Blyttiomyces sp. JEL0837]|nr:hypothetical protein HDU76_000928 [Blyttiomyces sp. JEL0837]